MAMRQVIDFLTIAGHPETGHKVSNEEALSFIKTHNQDIFSGDIDPYSIEDVWTNYDEFEAVNRPSESTIDESKRKKTKGGKMVQEADYDTGGYVESMGPKFDKACDTLSRAFGEWADGPMTEPGMIEPAKKDVVQYIDQKLTEQFLEEAIEEKKGTDHDKDGDIDIDDYMASKDKAIKAALKENVKAIISKILTEDTINEAATAKLSDWGAGYESFEGVKPVVNELENIVTELESFYDRMNDKISKAFEKTNNFKNDEGLNIGAFIAPSLEAAFLQDLRPIRKNFLKGGIALPKVKTISSAEINQMKADGLAEDPKSNIFQPVTYVKR